MLMHRKLVYDSGIHPERNAENNHVTLKMVLFGFFMYMFLVIPVLSLLVVGSLNLGSEFVIPVATAWLLVGIYICENHICRYIP